MLKIFLYNKYIAVTQNYSECVKLSNNIVFLPQELSDIPPIVSSFISNQQLTNLCMYSCNIEEMQVFKKISSCFTKVTAAGGLVQNHKNELLMIYRFNNWDLPKGWCEEGESPEETAVREVEEECGLSKLELVAPITKTYHIYQQNGTWILKETHWFKLCCKKDEQPKPQHEESIEEARWIAKKDIPSYLDKAYLSIKEVFELCNLQS